MKASQKAQGVIDRWHNTGWYDSLLHHLTRKTCRTHEDYEHSILLQQKSFRFYKANIFILNKVVPTLKNYNFVVRSQNSALLLPEEGCCQI